MKAISRITLSTTIAAIICAVAYFIFVALSTPMPSYTLWQYYNLAMLMMIQQILAVITIACIAITMILIAYRISKKTPMDT